MSLLARYLSRRRRRPTSSKSPRRLWWSCLCTLRCSVRSAIRLESIATCASGDPVSPSLVPYSARIEFFVAVSSATGLLFSALCAPSVRVTRAERHTPVRDRYPGHVTTPHRAPSALETLSARGTGDTG